MFLFCLEMTVHFRHLLFLHLALIQVLWNTFYFLIPVRYLCTASSRVSDDTHGFEGRKKLWETPTSALRPCFHWMQFTLGATQAPLKIALLFFKSLCLLAPNLNLLTSPLVNMQSSFISGLKVKRAYASPELLIREQWRWFGDRTKASLVQSLAGLPVGGDISQCLAKSCWFACCVHQT